MKTHSYYEIANSYSLWEEYVDPSGLQSESQFDAMPIAERIAFIVSCFGAENNSKD